MKKTISALLVTLMLTSTLIVPAFAANDSANNDANSDTNNIISDTKNTEEVAEEVTEEATEEVAKEATEEVTEEVAKEVTEEVAEEVIEESKPAVHTVTYIIADCAQGEYVFFKGNKELSVYEEEKLVEGITGNQGLIKFFPATMQSGSRAPQPAVWRATADCNSFELSQLDAKGNPKSAWMQYEKTAERAYFDFQQGDLVLYSHNPACANAEPEVPEVPAAGGTEDREANTEEEVIEDSETPLVDGVVTDTETTTEDTTTETTTEETVEIIDNEAPLAAPSVTETAATEEATTTAVAVTTTPATTNDLPKTGGASQAAILAFGMIAVTGGIVLKKKN